MIKEISNATSFPMGKWILTNFLGWLSGFALVVGLVILFDTTGVEGVQFFIGTGMGAGLGFFQQRMLKRIFGIGEPWALYTTLGLTIPFVLLDILNVLGIGGQFSFFLPICVGAAGLLIGIGQAKLLKPLNIQPLRWIGISVVSWLLCGIAVYSIEYSMALSPREFTLAINLGLILIGGLIHGVITGSVFKALRR